MTMFSVFASNFSRVRCLFCIANAFRVFVNIVCIDIIAVFFVALHPLESKAQQGCGGIKQVLFVFDVSGSMKTNERLAETKKFALRTLQERALENLLYKVISYGGNCNDVVVEVDWTRDVTVVGAGIKGLYANGVTPLASSLDLAIDEIKKSAYPEETQICLMNNALNSCGSVKEILEKRLAEIPCVKFFTIGIELEELSTTTREKANEDLMLIAQQTGGMFVPLSDIRELTGVTLKDSGLTIVPVQFTPRKKAQTLAFQAGATEKEKSAQQNNSATTSQSTLSAATIATIATSQPRTDSTRPTLASNSSTNSTSSSVAGASAVTQNQQQASQNGDQGSSQSSKNDQGLSQGTSSQSVSSASGSSKRKKSQRQATQSQKSTAEANSPGTSANNSSEKTSDAWQWKAIGQITEKSTRSKVKKQPANSKQFAQSNSEQPLQQDTSKARSTSSPVEQSTSARATNTQQTVNTPENTKQSSKTEAQQPVASENQSTNLSVSVRSKAAKRTANVRPNPIIAQVQASSTTPVWDSIPSVPFIFEFSAKSASLTPASQRDFVALLQYIKQQYLAKPTLQITVEGHSSNEGSRVENLRLAVSRASSIASTIRRHVGLQDTAVTWNAFGALKPAFDERFPLAQIKNRRVEVIVRW